MADGEKQYVPLPDGSYLELPAEMKDEDINAVLKKNAGQFGLPGQPQTTMRAAETVGEKLRKVAGYAPLAERKLGQPGEDPSLIQRLGALTTPIEGYTEQGRAEHPILSRIGDVTRGVKEYGRLIEPLIPLMVGNQGPPSGGAREGLLPRTYSRRPEEIMGRGEAAPETLPQTQPPAPPHEDLPRTEMPYRAERPEVMERNEPAPETLPRTHTAEATVPPAPFETPEEGRPLASPTAEGRLDAIARELYGRPYAVLTPEERVNVARQLGEGGPGGIERRVTPGEAPLMERRAGAMPLPQAGRGELPATPTPTPPEIARPEPPAEEGTLPHTGPPPAPPPTTLGGRAAPPKEMTLEEWLSQQPGATPPDPLKQEFPDPKIRQFGRTNGFEILRSGASVANLQAVQDLNNVQIREAAINSGIDVGQKHVGSRIGLGPEQISRQDLIDQMIKQGVKAEDIPGLAKPRTQEIPAGQLKVGDTFVDESGEPRRVVEVTEDGKIKTADGTARTYTDKVDSQGPLNSPTAQLARGGKFIAHPEGSTVPLMQRPPASAAEGPSTLDVAKQLNRYTRSEIGSLSLAKAAPEEMVGRARELAIDEAQHQLQQANSGKDWYKADIAKHDKILQNEVRPELKDPAKLSIFKFAEAILSLSNRPNTNITQAVKAWDFYSENGVFNPVQPNGKSWGNAKASAYGNAFRYLNDLIDAHGEKGASEWLLADHPTSELRAINPKVPGDADEMQPGAMILGDKRGPFALNLHGIESAFTADRWVSRTWNRWMGTLEWDKETGQMLTDAPRNDTERSLMRQSFEEAADSLGLSTSQLQAVLWFYEQGLYRAMGAEAESQTFSGAARRAADMLKPSASGRAQSAARTSPGLSRRR